MNRLKKAVILMAILTLVASFHTAIVLTAEPPSSPNGHPPPSDQEVFRTYAFEGKSIFLGPVWAVVGVGWIGLGIVIIRQKRERRFQNE